MNTKLVKLKIEITSSLHLYNPSSELRQKLMAKLKFTNPKWQDNQRMGRWNRETPRELKFFDKTPGGGFVIPRGYMRQLILLCRQMDISWEIIERRRLLPPEDFKFQGDLKPFQQKAVDAMLARDFGTLTAPTGSGKTVMALAMIAERRQPALIIVHTKELAAQWMQRSETFLGIPVESVGFIGAGKNKVGKLITVALVQSLYKCSHDVSSKIGFLIVDECHRCPSRIFTEAVTAFDSRYMLGLSATPWRRDNLSRLIFWHLGDVHYQVPHEELVEDGHILEAEIIWRQTEFRAYFDPVREYTKMLTELVSDDSRNRMIAEDVACEVEKQKCLCLVLSDRKKHCRTLQALLKYKHGIAAELLTGALSLAERQKVLARLNSGQVSVLVATGQLIGEGFDHPGLASLFLATPIRFSGRVIQYLGRILRPAPGKDKARVFDYVDHHVEVLKVAAEARKRAYSRAK